jgi:ketosteroid isomerase-like protein
MCSVTPQLAGAKMDYCTGDWKDVQRRMSGALIIKEWNSPHRRSRSKGNGKILLILKRQADGSWRVALESWNSSPQPQAKN